MFHVEQRSKNNKNAARRPFFVSDLKQAGDGLLQG
jgi:hypothetical protein